MRRNTRANAAQGGTTKSAVLTGTPTVCDWRAKLARSWLTASEVARSVPLGTGATEQSQRAPGQVALKLPDLALALRELPAGQGPELTGKSDIQGIEPELQAKVREY